MMKALGAFMMSGGAEDMDFSNPTESFEAFAPILLALKDDDEVECEGADIAKVLVASEEYIQCSGEYTIHELLMHCFIIILAFNFFAHHHTILVHKTL